MTSISKSNYMSGLKCSKLLWYIYNEKDSIPEISDSTKAIFDQGHEVGELAKTLYPKGVDLKDLRARAEVLSETDKAIQQRKPIFEAGIQHKDAYCRVDVLNPVGKDEWDLIEVKSGTSVEDHHIDDIAFQKYCCLGKRLKIRNCYLMHINNEYVRKGKLDVKQLLKAEDITKDLEETLPFIKENIKQFLKDIEGSKPRIEIGPFCKKPYECAMKDVCWNYLPNNNVFQISNIRQKAYDLLEQGIQAIKDIPPGFKLSPSQEIQKDAIINNKTHIDEAAIKSFLRHLEYPIHYFDFETIGGAIPMFDDTKAYQQVPFQYSLHIQEEDGTVKHHEYLHDGTDDPRPNILKFMKEQIKDKGTMIAYSQGFEIKAIKKMAEAFPKYKKWSEGIITRFKDLATPFMRFNYYNPSQKGRWSLKATMPALTGVGYDNLEIGDGGTAQMEYMRITYGEASEENKKKIRKLLLKYCCQDTEGMIWMVDKLKKIVKR